MVRSRTLPFDILLVRKAEVCTASIGVLRFSACSFVWNYALCGGGRLNMDLSKRDYQWDNIKGLIIILVIFTHAISNLYKGWSENTITKYLYYLGFSFHMPVMIFISGYFSKRKTDYRTYIVKAIKSCLIPFFVFNFLYGLPSVKSALYILSPKWTLWYLLSLFCWKVLSEIVSKFKWSIPLVLLTSLYIGLFPVGSFLSLSRTIGFFPFFLVGYYCRQEHVSKVRAVKKILPIAAFIITLIIAGILSNTGIKAATLFFRDSYKTLGQTYIQGIALRAVLLITGFLCVFGFVSIMPAKKTVISNFGMYSITVYLGHSLAIRILKHFKIISISNPFVFIGFAVLFSLALSFALGNKKVFNLYQKIIGKIGDLIIAS